MLKSFCQYFFIFSSTSKSRTPIHSYRQDEEDGQNSFSNFIFFFLFKIQLLFSVNARVIVMKVLLFVFAGAMVDLSTPLVIKGKGRGTHRDSSSYMRRFGGHQAFLPQFQVLL